MAQVLPAKRPRSLTDHHRTSLHGSAGPSRYKRPRHSIEPSERSYSEDVESQAADDVTSNAGVNDGFEEEAYLRQTQLVQKSIRQNVNEKNVPAEAGIIEEVRCTNFMCHDQLTVPLGPLINFIIGHNGSGKSAVLTALTVCLGGKASATNRGQNLKSFIKTGRQHATLSVKLKNQGDLAYRPELYGNSIIVERHFSHAGSSGFKLKDQNGRIVSQKKADVEDILDAFALQLDNPMNVLTQDMARQFLNSSTPKDKYKFFLKGTQLETLDNDYKQISLELEEQEAKAQTIKGDVDVLKKNFQDAVAKAGRATKLEKARANETVLAHQAAWAQVESEERELAGIEASIEHTASIIEKRKAIADQESAKFAQFDKSLEQAQQEVQECEAEMQPTQDEHKELQVQFKEVKARIFNMKADERTLMSSMRMNDNKIRESQSNIEEHRNKQAEADNGLHARRVQEYEDAKKDYEDRKARWGNHSQGLPTLNEQVNQAKSLKRQIDENIQRKRNAATVSRSKLHRFDQDDRKWTENYQNHAGLERVLDAIQNERRFRERPVGPMGRHVELLKPEWSSILEKSFGAALEGFIVTNKADKDLLSRLMARLNYRAPVYIGTKAPIDTTGHEPDEQLLTWMRVLKINNDLVRNSLIINQNIDQVVLIENRTEAWNFMRRRAANTKSCICMADTGRKLGHLITPGPNISPIEEFSGSPRMHSDKGQQVQDEKDTYANLQREILALEAQASAAQDQINICQAKIRDHATVKQNLKREMDRAGDDVYRLEGEVSASVPDAAMIEQLESELSEAKADYEKDDEQFTDLTKELDKANAEQRTSKDRLDALSEIIADCKRRADKLNAKVTTLTSRRDKALRGKNAALEQVEEAKTRLTEWEQRREEQREKVKKYEKDAAEIVPVRVEVPEGATFQSLKAKLDRLVKQRERMEEELGGSEAELLRLANEAKKTYMDAANEIKNTEMVRRALKQALKNRQQRWLEFRQGITVRARVVFNYLLSERQFRGTLQVDHDNHRLDINVQPDITVQNAEGRQTKTLSGGEKSFSTICLLLSLWDAMGSPIRCLDEFDVYMDPVNRDISTTMIVSAARRAIGRQYILITPQSMNMHSMDDVRIIRMADPERGQTALNFSG
ncbi:dna repair protein-like protein rad18 [Byssothecium circinans]|uniref:Dna repair protein-like protein rad18 n=1 Tax=Byssothecium circinans TaxID=147558 RepID=A0A6A5TXP4_9PLEO|nr:dna repair protein-like protein rad18 [Byssothecium circinans]